MFAELEIKCKSYNGYKVTYQIHELIISRENEKEFFKQCELALKDAFRVMGFDKPSKQKPYI